jgi:nucleoside-triphosphatase
LEGKYFITGPPSSGKSTVMAVCVREMRERGLKVGGIATPEVRERGRRTGFDVVNLATGETSPLARAGMGSRFRVGRYGVDLESFESLALPALRFAQESCDVVCIDEIGRMELFSKPFEEMVEGLIHGSKPVIAVLHRNYTETYGKWGRLLHVSPENRGRLPTVILARLEAHLAARGA